MERLSQQILITGEERAALEAAIVDLHQLKPTEHRRSEPVSVEHRDSFRSGLVFLALGTLVISLSQLHTLF